MNEEQALASYVAQGNQHAFEQLIRKHQRLVEHMISRVVDNPEDLEEICQDVFLKVYEKISEFNFQSKLSTWIATIAYRHAINHLRKRKIKLADIDEQFEHQFIADDSPSDTLEEDEMDSIVLSMIDKLPPQYKIVLTLFHLEEMNYAEIGKATGMPEGTVKNYLFRARQLLKEKVKTYLGKEV